jgi:alpha-1,2-mannosyltransferase
LLIGLDGIAIYRAIQGNPYPNWKTTTDFGSYLRASAAYADGKDLYAYEPCPCNLFYGTQEIHDQYPYPPFFAALLAPLTYAGDIAARYVWLFINLGCIAGGLILLLRGFGTQVRWPWIALAFGVICLSRIGRSDLYHGQVNFLLMFLLTLGLWFYSKGRQTTAGIVLGVAFVIKPFLGIILLYFLWRRQWRTACASALTGAVLLGLSFAPFLIRDGSTSIIQSWLATSAYYSSGQVAARPDNYSLNGLLLRLFSSNYFTTPWLENSLLLRILSISLIVFLLTTCASALPPKDAWQAALRANPALLLVEVGLLLGLTMTYGPMTERDHFFMLVPAFVGVLLLAKQRLTTQSSHRQLWWWVTAAWAFFFALQASPIKLNLGGESSETWSRLAGPAILLTGQVGLLLLIMTVLLAYVLRRERKTLRYSSI